MTNQFDVILLQECGICRKKFKLLDMQPVCWDCFTRDGGERARLAIALADAYLFYNGVVRDNDTPEYEAFLAAVRAYTAHVETNTPPSSHDTGKK